MILVLDLSSENRIMRTIEAIKNDQTPVGHQNQEMVHCVWLAAVHTVMPAAFGTSHSSLADELRHCRHCEWLFTVCPGHGWRCHQRNRATAALAVDVDFHSKRPSRMQERTGDGDA